MAIQYSGNAQTFTFSTGPSTPASDAETAIVNGLVAAGWSNTTNPASDVLTFSARPADSSTVTLDSGGNTETYTFVTVFSNTAFNVLIGASTATSISNLVAAITGGAGGGSLYGNGAGYVVHPTITAVGTSSTLTASYKVAGSAGNGAPVSTTGTINATWAAATLLGGGNTLLSAITPQGLQASILIFTAAGNNFEISTTFFHAIPGSRERGITGPDLVNAALGTNTAWRCICNKYQFLLLTPGTNCRTCPLSGMALLQPFIPSSLQAPLISAATNASPIVCTQTGHGYTTGQSVLILGGLGNTAMNGSSVITVVDANTFSLNETTGNGTYITNTAYCANTTIGNTIIEAITTSGGAAANPTTFRSAFNPSGAQVWQTVNRVQATNASSGSSPVIFWPTATQWYDNSYLLYEPLIGWSPSGSGSQLVIGQIWDAVALRFPSISIDQTATFDSPSHNFWTTTLDSGSPSSALLMATS